MQASVSAAPCLMKFVVLTGHLVLYTEKRGNVAEAVRKIENEKGRDARDVEVAEVMGLELNEYHKILQDATGCRIFSFEDPGTIGEDGFTHHRLDNRTSLLRICNTVISSRALPPRSRACLSANDW